MDNFLLGKYVLVRTPQNSLEGSPILGTSGLDFPAHLSYQASFQWICSVPVFQQLLWLVQQPAEMTAKPCCNPSRNKPWSSFGCVLLINIADAELSSPSLSRTRVYKAIVESTAKPRAHGPRRYTEFFCQCSNQGKCLTTGMAQAGLFINFPSSPAEWREEGEGRMRAEGVRENFCKKKSLRLTRPQLSRSMCNGDMTPPRRY